MTSSCLKFADPPLLTRSWRCEDWCILGIHIVLFFVVKKSPRETLGIDLIELIKLEAARKSLRFNQVQ